MLCRLMEPRASGLYAIIMPPGASNLCARFRDFLSLGDFRLFFRPYKAAIQTRAVVEIRCAESAF
jgi:hypothetical protein